MRVTLEVDSATKEIFEGLMESEGASKNVIFKQMVHVYSGHPVHLSRMTLQYRAMLRAIPVQDRAETVQDRAEPVQGLPAASPPRAVINPSQAVIKPKPGTPEWKAMMDQGINPNHLDILPLDMELEAESQRRLAESGPAPEPTKRRPLFDRLKKKEQP